MHPIFTPNFDAGFLKVILDPVYQELVNMFPTKRKADQSRADQAAKRGLSAVEDLFVRETVQFKAELEAEGLPTHLSPLEAAMALSAQEEARPLHKLSRVRISFKLLICRPILTCFYPVSYVNFPSYSLNNG